jgi:hypothetical protein
MGALEQKDQHDPNAGKRVFHERPGHASASVMPLASGRRLLQSYHDAVDRTAAIHHGEPHEGRPFRLE